MADNYFVIIITVQCRGKEQFHWDVRSLKSWKCRGEVFLKNDMKETRIQGGVDLVSEGNAAHTQQVKCRGEYW